MTVTDTTTEQTLIDDVHAIEQHAVETVLTVRAEADEQIRGLKATIAALAAERDRARADAERERIHAKGMLAVNQKLTADAIVREEALQAELADAQRARNLALAEARTSAEITAAMSRDLDQARRDRARLLDDNLHLRTDLGAANTENAELRRQLADARRPRILRRPRPTT